MKEFMTQISSDQKIRVYRRIVILRHHNADKQFMHGLWHAHPLRHTVQSQICYSRSCAVFDKMTQPFCFLFKQEQSLSDAHVLACLQDANRSLNIWCLDKDHKHPAFPDATAPFRWILHLSYEHCKAYNNSAALRKREQKLNL